MSSFALILVCALSISDVPAAPAQGEERLRVIIETDAGGDPDDEQSLVRFLLYSNEWDIEGIIANRDEARDGENLNPERTGLGIVRALIGAYGAVEPSLKLHDPGFPPASRLLERTVVGYRNSEDGVRRVLEALDSPDPRPVWFLNWGTDDGSAPSCLLRVLDQALETRGSEGYSRLKSRLRLSSADKFRSHTFDRLPPFPIWVDTFRPEIARKRWYHRFSELTRTAGGFDLERDVRTGHGPLGALYPTNTTHRQKEGDSMTFIYLIPTGMNDPGQPGWGSWAGRYGVMPEHPGRPYYWADQPDNWGGATHRDQSLARWAAALQNDFRARLDWCVKPFKEANHPPRVVLNGTRGSSILRMKAAPGARVQLDAAQSDDPDGDPLSYEWSVYAEAGSYRGTVSIGGATGQKAVLEVPADVGRDQIHVILAVTDSGSPPLTRYRRVVVDGEPAAVREEAWKRLQPLTTPSAELAEKRGAYRSPLLFADGSSVRDADGWKRRRAEILGYWNEALGPWPEPIEKPTVETLFTSRRGAIAQRRVRVETAPGRMDEAWLLVPDGPGPFPAALVVYYEPETSVGLAEHPLRDFGHQLARRGFVTLSLGAPGSAWEPELSAAKCQPLHYLAYMASNGWRMLAGMKEVDPERIGIVGHSFGGKWALFAAGFFERFACVAVSDPGIVFDETRPNVNYWEPWYLGRDETAKRPRPGLPAADNPRTGAYKRLVDEGHDLHEVLALIAPRPLLVSGGAEDPPERWTALLHAVDVNRILGQTNRIALSARAGHDPTRESNDQVYAFFEHWLGR